MKLMPDAELMSLQKQSQLIIKEGSKSFSFASHIFSTKSREACHMLYHWCRYCDDIIDRAETENQSLDVMTTKTALEFLEAELSNVYTGVGTKTPAFQAFQSVAQKYGIPKTYASDLLSGFQTDVEQKEFRTEADLELYCYQVAGVVGLMMCQIMGLSDPNARKFAVDLGIAMQMTNIARDLFEDFNNGRVYLPSEWLQESKLDKKNLFDQPLQLFKVAQKLLRKADQYYESGYKGLTALPLRAAIAVSIAGAVYSGIGKKILAAGPQGLKKRMYLTRFEKLISATKGCIRLIPLALKRLIYPWKPVHLDQPFQFQCKSNS